MYLVYHQKLCPTTAFVVPFHDDNEDSTVQPPWVNYSH